MRFVAHALMFVGFGWIALSMAFFFWLAIWASWMGAPWLESVVDFWFVVLISAAGGIIMNGFPGLVLILIGAVLARMAPSR